MHQQEMVRISVEVRSGAASFRVGVQAPSVREALAMVAGRYSHGDVRVAFPIEPESFFVSGPAGAAGMAGSEHARPEAA